MNGKRFEDYLSVEDLMKLPNDELLAKIYVQTLKTNGTIAQHCTDIEDLKNDMKDKIGMKLFAWLSGAVAFLIILFNVIDRIMT